MHRKTLIRNVDGAFLAQPPHSGRMERWDAIVKASREAGLNEKETGHVFFDKGIKPTKEE